MKCADCHRLLQMKTRLSAPEKSSELHDNLPMSSAGEIVRQNSTQQDFNEQLFLNDTITTITETKPVKPCAVHEISTCWDNLGKISARQRAKFIDSAQPTSSLDIWQTAKGDKHRPQSPLTLQLENRFEPFINLSETEVEMTTDRFENGVIMKTVSRKKKAKKWSQRGKTPLKSRYQKDN